ncbi:hypothetical protein HYZ97_00710 [Candidatus Pacearchaeota archaeon]|nr:hypothetical protein [Candidatus Pacearchaeota archaeon]
MEPIYLLLGSTTCLSVLLLLMITISFRRPTLHDAYTSPVEVAKLKKHILEEDA